MSERKLYTARDIQKAIRAAEERTERRCADLLTTRGPHDYDPWNPLPALPEKSWRGGEPEPEPVFHRGEVQHVSWSLVAGIVLVFAMGATAFWALDLLARVHR